MPVVMLTGWVSTDMARARRAAPAPEPEVDWTQRNQEDALEQGWGVFECVDEKTRKLFLILQADGPRFKNDNDARVFVKAQSEQGDTLATRALRAVFRSMAGRARSK